MSFLAGCFLSMVLIMTHGKLSESTKLLVRVICMLRYLFTVLFKRDPVSLCLSVLMASWCVGCHFAVVPYLLSGSP